MDELVKAWFKKSDTCLLTATGFLGQPQSKSIISLNLFVRKPSKIKHQLSNKVRYDRGERSIANRVRSHSSTNVVPNTFRSLGAIRRPAERPPRPGVSDEDRMAGIR